jgi:hypothetical protein
MEDSSHRYSFSRHFCPARIYALFPRLVFEPEICRVFGHRSLDLIRGPIREISGDFYRHFYRGIWITA